MSSRIVETNRNYIVERNDDGVTKIYKKKKNKKTVELIGIVTVLQDGWNVFLGKTKNETIYEKEINVEVNFSQVVLRDEKLQEICIL